MLAELVKVANKLDSLGLTREADLLDQQIVRYAAMQGGLAALRKSREQKGQGDTGPLTQKLPLTSSVYQTTERVPADKRKSDFPGVSVVKRQYSDPEVSRIFPNKETNEYFELKQKIFSDEANINRIKGLATQKELNAQGIRRYDERIEEAKSKGGPTNFLEDAKSNLASENAKINETLKLEHNSPEKLAEYESLLQNNKLRFNDLAESLGLPKLEGFEIPSSEMSPNPTSRPRRRIGRGEFTENKNKKIENVESMNADFSGEEERDIQYPESPLTVIDINPDLYYVLRYINVANGQNEWSREAAFDTEEEAEDHIKRTLKEAEPLSEEEKSKYKSLKPFFEVSGVGEKSIPSQYAIERGSLLRELDLILERENKIDENVAQLKSVKETVERSVKSLDSDIELQKKRINRLENSLSRNEIERATQQRDDFAQSVKILEEDLQSKINEVKNLDDLIKKKKDLLWNYRTSPIPEKSEKIKNLDKLNREKRSLMKKLDDSLAIKSKLERGSEEGKEEAFERFKNRYNSEALDAKISLLNKNIESIDSEIKEIVSSMEGESHVEGESYLDVSEKNIKDLESKREMILSQISSLGAKGTLSEEIRSDLDKLTSSNLSSAEKLVYSDKQVEKLEIEKQNILNTLKRVEESEVKNKPAAISDLNNKIKKIEEKITSLKRMTTKEIAKQRAILSGSERALERRTSDGGAEIIALIDSAKETLKESEKRLESILENINNLGLFSTKLLSDGSKPFIRHMLEELRKEGDRFQTIEVEEATGKKRIGLSWQERNLKKEKLLDKLFDEKQISFEKESLDQFIERIKKEISEKELSKANEKERKTEIKSELKKLGDKKNDWDELQSKIFYLKTRGKAIILPGGELREAIQEGEVFDEAKFRLNSLPWEGNTPTMETIYEKQMSSKDFTSQKGAQE